MCKNYFNQILKYSTTIFFNQARRHIQAQFNSLKLLGNNFWPKIQFWNILYDVCFILQLIFLVMALFIFSGSKIIDKQKKYVMAHTNSTSQIKILTLSLRTREFNGAYKYIYIFSKALFIMWWHCLFFIKDFFNAL